MEATRLHFLGTGNAFNEDARASAGLFVEPAEGEPFLVDAGPNLMHAIQGEGLELGRLSRLFVTHLHGDHTAGWPFLLLRLATLERRKEPLEVIGPPGTKETFEGLAALCYGEILDDPPFDVVYRELPVAEHRTVLCGSSLRCDVLPMQHHASSIGYRLELPSAILAISGDTAWCENLELLADGSDALIVECSSVGRLPVPHLCLEELREKVDRLRARHILLVHLNDEVAEDLASDPLPRVSAAHDGMVFAI